MTGTGASSHRVTLVHSHATHRFCEGAERTDGVLSGSGHRRPLGCVSARGAPGAEDFLHGALGTFLKIHGADVVRRGADEGLEDGTANER